jgi:hypothetical protein
VGGFVLKVNRDEVNRDAVDVIAYDIEKGFVSKPMRGAWIKCEGGFLEGEDDCSYFFGAGRVRLLVLDGGWSERK